MNFYMQCVTRATGCLAAAGPQASRPQSATRAQSANSLVPTTTRAPPAPTGHTLTRCAEQESTHVWQSPRESVRCSEGKQALRAAKDPATCDVFQGFWQEMFVGMWHTVTQHHVRNSFSFALFRMQAGSGECTPCLSVRSAFSQVESSGYSCHYPVSTAGATTCCELLCHSA